MLSILAVATSGSPQAISDFVPYRGMMNRSRIHGPGWVGKNFWKILGPSGLLGIDGAWTAVINMTLY